MTTLRSAREAVELAKAADAAGFWALGFADTAPELYQAVYPSVAAALLATSRVRIGPLVTNPVTRHWSVHASTVRTMEELAPGRFFFGVSTGDGSVHSVGLKPATWPQVEDLVHAIKPHAPEAFEVHVAASGKKGSEVAGRVATDFTIGTGLDVTALRGLAARARASRLAAGNHTPLRVWANAPTYFVPHETDVTSARDEIRGHANAGARFALAVTFEEKHVPEAWQQPLRKGLDGYDFAHHSQAGKTNPNGKLFDDRPELQNYLLDRFSVVGTPEQCRMRLVSLVRDAALDGVWVPLLPSPIEDNPQIMLERATEAFGPFLASASGNG